jgi:hypothetical protein
VCASAAYVGCLLHSVAYDGLFLLLPKQCCTGVALVKATEVGRYQIKAGIGIDHAAA